MDTLKDVMNELASLGDESVVKMFKSHGAHEPLYGVKVGDMKKILKRNKIIICLLWHFTIPGILMRCIWQD